MKKIQAIKIGKPSILPTSFQQVAIDRGVPILTLEADLLLKRIQDGGFSGDFLAAAFLSMYRMRAEFVYSLGELIKLDAEGFRLFHEILHVRFCKGWNDDFLYELEQKIMAVK
ncbi:hypothetical protein [Methylobacter sp. S3L5C]|uniref:hypothetical protein n=1 Tax=Methylobacter sp. S3L5C TaxID=2839024 RepID=UPI001FAB8962|nr:hypothetical protein [Methylobacter sp. S3L5C]UOA08501.1 hypothetical protein KKZ03_20280 [Methylobacter sp. S3L5C]